MNRCLLILEERDGKPATDYESPRLLGCTRGADGEEANHLLFEVRPHGARWHVF